VIVVDEVERGTQEFFVYGLHALGVERAGIFYGLLADLAIDRVDGRVIPVACFALKHTSRPEFRTEARVFWIIGVLRLFFCVEMIEVAEELVEAMNSRQKLVEIAQMVLAELAGGVAERLQRFCDGHILGAKTNRCARQPDFRKPGADRRLSGDEGGAASRAALLGVPVSEQRAFLGDTIDVRGPVSHDAHVEGAHVKPADIVTHDHQDVGLATTARCGGGGGLLRLRHFGGRDRPQHRCSGYGCGAKENTAAGTPPVWRHSCHRTPLPAICTLRYSLNYLGAAGHQGFAAETSRPTPAMVEMGAWPAVVVPLKRGTGLGQSPPFGASRQLPCVPANVS
jgi:hypothetical protein